jgi:hypothetical protein
VAQFTIAKNKSVARGTLCVLRYVTAYFTFGIFASAAAALFGFFFTSLIGLGWQGTLGAFAMPVIPIFGFLVGFLLSMPVTFVVLPALALLLNVRSATQVFVLAVSGAIAGGGTMALMPLLFDHAANPSKAAMFIVTGTGAGMIAGMTYAAGLRNLRKLSDRRPA